MKRINFKAMAAALCLLLLTVNATAAQTSAREGVKLCLQVLIPSLFPFFVCSVMLTGSLKGKQTGMLRPLEHLFRIPGGSGVLLPVAFLGGYPSGAQCIALSCENGQLPRAEARRMLAFCNNAGPAFLFGMVAPFFEKPIIPWILWSIHILSAWLVAAALPAQGSIFAQNKETRSITLPEALEKSLKITASVCGWVILFRMVVGILQPVLLDHMPKTVQVLIKGALELSNGCICLNEITSPGLRFVTVSALLAFGGLCVTMQTRSVCGSIPMDLYFPGKILQMLFSLLLSVPIQTLLFPQPERLIPHPALVAVPLALTGILISRLKSTKNKSSIPIALGV